MFMTKNQVLKIATMLGGVADYADIDERTRRLCVGKVYLAISLTSSIFDGTGKDISKLRNQFISLAKAKGPIPERDNRTDLRNPAVLQMCVDNLMSDHINTGESQ
jgi:hypothetical protein